MMRNTQKTYNNSGFTVLELLVASSLGLLVTAILFGTAILQKNVFKEDITRNHIESNLRPTIMFLGQTIRQAGEYLNKDFPVIEITQDVNLGSQVLTLRRSASPYVLSVCSDVNAGDVEAVFALTASPPTPACDSNTVFSSGAFSSSANQHGIRVKNIASRYKKGLYIHNPIENVGEFFLYANRTYSTQVDNAHAFFTNGEPFKYNYPALSSKIYYLEEFKFYRDTEEESLNFVIDNGFLQDEKWIERPIAYNITNFEVEARYGHRTEGHCYWDDDQMGWDAFLNAYYAGEIEPPWCWNEEVYTSTDTFPPDDANWKDIEKIVVKITGKDSYKGEIIEKTIEGSFYPRNIKTNS